MQKDVFIEIIVVTLNPHDQNDVFVLSTTPDSIVLPRTTWQSLDGVYKQFVDLDFEWMNVQLLDVLEETSDSICVAYCSALPTGTDLKFGHWLRVDKNLDTKIQKLIIKACSLL